MEIHKSMLGECSQGPREDGPGDSSFGRLNCISGAFFAFALFYVKMSNAYIFSCRVIMELYITNSIRVISCFVRDLNCFELIRLLAFFLCI